MGKPPFWQLHLVASIADASQFSQKLTNQLLGALTIQSHVNSASLTKSNSESFQFEISKIAEICYIFLVVAVAKVWGEYP